MAIRLKPTTDYDASKRDLGPSARIALRFLENEIRADPDHRSYRQELELPGIGSVVVDHGARGLLVVFHRVNDGLVSLDEVIDLRHPRPWYSAP